MFNYNLLPTDTRDTIAKYAGSVYNHSVYFESMTPLKHPLIPSNLQNALFKAFNSLEGFLLVLKKQATILYGSGFVFLVSDETGALKLVSCPNSQTTVTSNLYPIIGIDVWEHAYFLKYYSDRSNYIDGYLQIIDWQKAADKYDSCLHLTK